tara:strand:+ start:106 stop:699 length:594 start_codon:yes stop_codon:yes gene_type:complete
MSFLVGGALAIGGASIGAIATGAGVGAMVGKTLMGGFGAQTEDEAIEQKKIAKEMHQERLTLLGGQRDASFDQAQLGFDVTQSQTSAAERGSITGAQIGMRGVQDYTKTATSKSNLVTSGTIQQKAQIGAGDIRTKFKDDITKIFETRSLAKKERDISRNKADLSFRQGEMSAEDVYESTLTNIDSQPTGFLEGMFS